MKKIILISIYSLISLTTLSAKADRLQDIYQHIKDKHWFSDTTYNRIKKDGLFRFLVADGLCPVIPEDVKEDSAENLLAKGDELMQRKRHCKAAQYYYKTLMRWPVIPYYKTAWIKLIKSYVAAEDYILAINEANDLLSQMPGIEEFEEIHYLIMKSVYLKMKEADVDTYQEWTYYALGISSDQNKSNPYFQNIMFSSFLEKYPNSDRAAEINQWKIDARNQLNYYHLRIGQQYYHDHQFKAALMRYSFVLKYGITVAPFAETMYECVRTSYDFAKNILIPRNIPDERLAELMQLPEGSPVNRAKVSEATRNQALNFLAQMEKNLPDNEWTLLAREYVEYDGMPPKKKKK